MATIGVSELGGFLLELYAGVNEPPMAPFMPDALRALKQTARLHGRNAEMLDAFVFGKGDVGDMRWSGRLAPFLAMGREPLLSQVPESIEVELLATEHPPGGVGEIGATEATLSSKA